MHLLSPSRMLDLWERGAQQHPLDRNLLLLAGAQPGESLQALADVPVGQRDQVLLAWRSANFGRALPAYVDCPACHTRLEFTLDSEALCSDQGAAPIIVDGMAVRRPTSRDLAAVLQQADPEQAAYQLAQRCCAGAPGDLSALPTLSPEQAARIEQALAATDTAADIMLDLACEHCGNAWQAEFDIGGYLWQEIEAQAARLLAEIHTLARAYGWSERDLLGMSAVRRAAYLGMVST